MNLLHTSEMRVVCPAKPEGEGGSCRGAAWPRVEKEACNLSKRFIFEGSGFSVEGLGRRVEGLAFRKRRAIYQTGQRV